ncbi:phospholipase [Microbacterium sp. M28]|uniref:aggregation-promoting factor C-terminal-like domain-containing protein n=1 Tax=Microbacterium sp. M28 TaxID=2962064 RepID=UPI0021F4BD6F|nr:phospholipase [Microbacterium sp. M28]UYO98100.1 phospholipase [Microbacterium sp. M28]
MSRPARVRADDDPKVEPFMLHSPNTRASARAATLAHAHADVTSRHPLVLGIALGAALSVAITAGTASSAAAAAEAHSGAIASLATVTDADPFAPATGAVRMAVPMAGITEDAQVAVETAQATLADAAALTAEVAASGLTLDTATTTIDTSALETDVAELAAVVDDAAPATAAPAAAAPADLTAPAAAAAAAPALPEPASATEADSSDAPADDVEKAPLELVVDTADVTATTATIAAATATLREALTAAQKAEAERKAAAERAAAAQAAANTPAGAKATARAMAASQYGWGDGEFSCLESLWTKESGWNYKAYNPSGATGIPQSLPGDKMATAGADWRTNATTQIAWGLSYIDRAYGSPCAAWGHSQATDWY